MCFSEEASFVAAGVLGATALLSLKIASANKRLLYLALIPLFFSLQQAAEGVEWLVLKGRWNSPEMLLFAKYVFVVIAYAIWPVWGPFSLLIPENDRFHRQILKCFLAIGSLIAIYSLSKIILYPVEVRILEASLYYDVAVERIWAWPYAVVVVFSWFFSRLPLTRPMGLLIGISTFISWYYYFEHFASIWCFFAAVISLCNVILLRKSVRILGAA